MQMYLSNETERLYLGNHNERNLREYLDSALFTVKKGSITKYKLNGKEYDLDNHHNIREWRLDALQYSINEGYIPVDIGNDLIDDLDSEILRESKDVSALFSLVDGYVNPLLPV